MLGKVAVFAMTLALSAVHVANASAAGMCFRLEGSETVVVKSKVPGRNKCVPFNGVEVSAPGAALSGMSCTSVDGTTLVVHYTSHDFNPSSRSRFESGTCRFPLPMAPVGPQRGDCTGMLIYQELGSA